MSLLSDISKEFSHNISVINAHPSIGRWLAAGICRACFPYDVAVYETWLKGQNKDDINVNESFQLLSGLFELEIKPNFSSCVPKSDTDSTANTNSMLPNVPIEICIESSFAPKLEQLNVLENILLPMMNIDVFSSHPFSPLVHAVIALICYKLDHDLEIWPFILENYPQTLSNILKQMRYIALGQDRTVSQIITHARFLSHCSDKLDVSAVWHAYRWFVDESLLKPLVKQVDRIGTVKDVSPAPLPTISNDIISALSDTYHITTRLQRLNDNERTFESLVHSLVDWLIENIVSVATGLMNSSITYIDSFLYCEAFAVVLRMLVDLTSQSLTGRYLSWYLFAYVPSDEILQSALTVSSAIPGSIATVLLAGNMKNIVQMSGQSYFHYLDVIHACTYFMPRERGRLLGGLTYQIYLNSLEFLKPSEGTALDESGTKWKDLLASVRQTVSAECNWFGDFTLLKSNTVWTNLALIHAHRGNCMVELFNRSTGLDSCFPDQDYLDDLSVTGNLFLPKLGVRYLDMSDYLRRNASLFKANVCHQLSEDFFFALKPHSKSVQPEHRSADSLYRVSKFSLPGPSPLPHLPSFFLAKIYLADNIESSTMAMEWMDIDEADPIAESSVEDISQLMSDFEQINVGNAKGISKEKTVVKGHPESQKNFNTRTRTLIGDSTASLSSCILLLSGHIEGSEMRFLRGCRYWKRGDEEQIEESGKSTRKVRPILVLVDLSFHEWYQAVRPVAVFDSVYLANPQLSAYTHVLGSVENILKTPLPAEYGSLWQRKLLLGHISPFDAIKLSLCLAEGGLPPRFELLGAVPNYHECVEALRSIWSKRLTEPVSEKQGNEVVKDKWSILLDDMCDKYIRLEWHTEDEGTVHSVQSQIFFETVSQPSQSMVSTKVSTSNTVFGRLATEASEKPSFLDTTIASEHVAPAEYSNRAAPFSLYHNQQVALLSALLNRCTMIVGPPGTGKTDVVVAITRVLCHNLWISKANDSADRQRVVLITQSNLALDQLIDKLLPSLSSVYKGSSVPILRLGGQYVSEAAGMCTPAAHRYDLIQQRTQVLSSFISRFASATVDSLGNQMLRKLTDFQCLIKQSISSKLDSFLKSFDSFMKTSFEEIYRDTLVKLRAASNAPINQALRDILVNFGVSNTVVERGSRRECYSALREVKMELLKFIEISRFCNLLPYELNKILIRNTPVLCLTCSGVAMKSHDLRGIRFDNVIVEEAGKILETELLPILNYTPGRLILVGDDKQLPPLVRDAEIRLKSKYSQSLFHRWQRLGVPHVTLNQQGRAVSSLCDLYRWRYAAESDVKLLDLPRAGESVRWPRDAPSFSSFLRARKQFVDVCTVSNNRSEINDIECEWILLFTRYLTEICGIPADCISVLSPYRAQVKNLKARFSQHICAPRDICTTDEFQGLQNDVILVSLVIQGRLPSDHLRDMRRVVVMLSRARQGLFLFGKQSTFKAATEWTPVFEAFGEDSSSHLEIVCDPRNTDTKFKPIHSISEFKSVLESYDPTEKSDIDDKTHDDLYVSHIGLSSVAVAWLNEMEEENSIIEMDDFDEDSTDDLSPVLEKPCQKKDNPSITKPPGLRPFTFTSHHGSIQTGGMRSDGMDVKNDKSRALPTIQSRLGGSSHKEKKRIAAELVRGNKPLIQSEPMYQSEPAVSEVKEKTVIAEPHIAERPQDTISTEKEKSKVVEEPLGLWADIVEEEEEEKKVTPLVTEPKQPITTNTVKPREQVKSRAVPGLSDRFASKKRAEERRRQVRPNPSARRAPNKTDWPEQQRFLEDDTPLSSVAQNWLETGEDEDYMDDDAKWKAWNAVKEKNEYSSRSSRRPR